MTAQGVRSPVHRKLIEFADSEPAWAADALLRFLERFVAGERGEASVQKWRDERAEAETVHMAG